jgi:predicted transcriptional regulator
MDHADVIDRLRALADVSDHRRVLVVRDAIREISTLRDEVWSLRDRVERLEVRMMVRD